MAPRLTITNAIEALEKFNQRYDTLDVFADDLYELQQFRRDGSPPPGLQVSGSHTLTVVDTPYEIELLPENGVARIQRVRSSVSPHKIIAGAAIGGIIGATLETAVTEKEGVGALGLLLGLLVGGTLASHQSTAPSVRRVFTLNFDSEEQKWRAYDGGLVDWMKMKLLPAAS
ncbi:MAG: hypothetical protein ACE366_30335 [Bradymonadia bacterium]